MPELPEVEAARKLLKSTFVGRRIESVIVATDPLVFQNISRRRLIKGLLGRSIKAATRIGKYLILDMDNAKSLILHFGMAGKIRRFTETAPPPFLKLALSTDKKSFVGLSDGRRLGRIWISNDGAKDSRLKKLGPDSYTALPPLTTFRTELRKRRTPIKSLLLNQTFLAGIGNYIADEVLYRAKIAPTRKGSTLKIHEVKRLRQSISQILKIAVGVNADADQYPRTWLFHYRWNRKNKSLPDGTNLRFDTVGGRTTVWAPSRQK